MNVSRKIFYRNNTLTLSVQLICPSVISPHLWMVSLLEITLGMSVPIKSWEQYSLYIVSLWQNITSNSFGWPMNEISDGCSTISVVVRWENYIIETVEREECPDSFGISVPLWWPLSATKLLFILSLPLFAMFTRDRLLKRTGYKGGAHRTAKFNSCTTRNSESLEYSINRLRIPNDRMSV